MECPVIATDYESSLIQADWYEEHGEELVADEIRCKQRLGLVESKAFISVSDASFCRSRTHNMGGSHCRFRKQHSTHWSRCRHGDHGMDRIWSVCNSRRCKNSASHCSARTDMEDE